MIGKARCGLANLMGSFHEGRMSAADAKEEKDGAKRRAEEPEKERISVTLSDKSFKNQDGIMMHMTKVLSQNCHIQYEYKCEKVVYKRLKYCNRKIRRVNY